MQHDRSTGTLALLPQQTLETGRHLINISSPDTHSWGLLTLDVEAPASDTGHACTTLQLDLQISSTRHHNLSVTEIVRVVLAAEALLPSPAYLQVEATDTLASPTGALAPAVPLGPLAA
jgi:hypothetical protein